MGAWSDRHTMLVRDAEPAHADVPEVLNQAWARVAAAMAEPEPRRRSRTTVVAGAAAAVLVAVGGTAAAGVLTSRTGEYVDREDWQAGGPGEELNPRGDDFRAVVAQETADIPFPSAAARLISLDFQEADAVRGAGDLEVRVSTSAVAGFVANDAICAWSNEWARATRAGDPSAVARATRALDGAAGWDAVVTLQALEPVRFGWLRGVERAAHGSSIPALGAALAGNVFCVLELVPDLPEALPAGDPRLGEATPGAQP